jgi:hypothetical protein
MAFDIEMIKKVYANFAERIQAARTITVGHSPSPKKYCMPTSGREKLLNCMKEESLTWILHQTV